MANTYNNIAVAYGNMGNYSQAFEYCKKDLAITRQLLGNESLAVAHTYNNMGVIQTKLLNFQAAMEFFKKVESIAINLGGIHHPLVVMCYINIGDLLATQEKSATALDYYFKALKIGQEIFGNSNPLITIADFGLAKAYFKNGQFTNALFYCQSALMSCVYGFSDKTGFSNPGLKDISSEQVLLQTLVLKAKVLKERVRAPHALSVRRRQQ